MQWVTINPDGVENENFDTRIANATQRLRELRSAGLTTIRRLRSRRNITISFVRSIIDYQACIQPLTPQLMSQANALDIETMHGERVKKRIQTRLRTLYGLPNLQTRRKRQAKALLENLELLELDGELNRTEKERTQARTEQRRRCAACTRK